LLSDKEILHYNLHAKEEEIAKDWLPEGPIVVGITAGASCPNNLIEETLVRLYELRGIKREQLEAAA
jgi:4-hydroxy-3-methylbut-2-enyl diphosphate reductase